jgi:hypothetical protein
MIADQTDTGGLNPHVAGITRETYNPSSGIALPWILNHNPGGFTPLMWVTVGDSIILQLGGVTHTYQVVKLSNTWGEGFFSGYQSQWDIILTTCDGAVNRRSAYAKMIS